MKQLLYISALLTLCLGSCKKYLEEEPKSFMTVDQYYKTPEQIKTAVDGAYTGLAKPYTAFFFGLPLTEYWSFENLTGTSMNPLYEEGYGTLTYSMDQLMLNEAFKNIYIPLANINSVIENVSKATVIDANTKQQYLGQMYFLRAYFYFRAVQLFGEVPLLTAPVSNPDDAQIPRATYTRIYDQIVADLKAAENSSLPMTDISGHVSMGAVKSLLAKVYLTMAGFPRQAGSEYYTHAYNKANEVISSNAFNLFPNYSDYRNYANKNKGEFIFMLQRDKQLAVNELHGGNLPSDVTPPISAGTGYPPGMLPTLEFYNVYDVNDARKADRVYFYQYKPGSVMNYKFWDDEAAITGVSGLNISLIRYADILLVAAEAKANADGGTTSDAAAIDAYYEVRHRAFPSEPKPTSITVDQVLKERFLELAFEGISWFDMIRSRKVLDDRPALNGVANPNYKKIVPLIGYRSLRNGALNAKAFDASNVLLPIPTTELDKNPRLKEPAQ